MTNQISFETIDDLDTLLDAFWVMRRSFRRSSYEAFPLLIEKLIRLEEAVDDATSYVEQAIETSRSAVVPADRHTPDIQRIQEFDALMRKLTDQIKVECATAQKPLDDRIAAPADPLGDFEIDVHIDYIADEKAIGYSGDSDNCLTSREYSMRQLLPGETGLLDGEWEIPNGSEVNKWPRGCWLFHDLVDHSYGPQNPRLALRNIEAIGKIWVEVIVRQQYWLDTRTGKWEQYHIEYRCR